MNIHMAPTETAQIVKGSIFEALDEFVCHDSQ